MEKQNKNLNGESKNNEKNYMIGKKKNSIRKKLFKSSGTQFEDPLQ